MRECTLTSYEDITMPDNGMVSTILSGATLLAVIGFGISAFLVGLKEFRKDVQDELKRLWEQKVQKEACKEFRDMEQKRWDEHREDSK